MQRIVPFSNSFVAVEKDSPQAFPPTRPTKATQDSDSEVETLLTKLGTMGIAEDDDLFNFQ